MTNALTNSLLSSDKVRLLTKSEVKELVNANQWQKLGQVFGFKPVYHFEGGHFLDWRCVPQSLLDVLREKPSPEVVTGRVQRVQKRKHIKQLLLTAQWDVLEQVYGFKPRFTLTPLGTHVIDWTCVPWDVYEILKCGGVVKPTPYLLEGGIYDPAQKPKRRSTPRPYLVPKEQRVIRRTLEERLPIRQRLYEAQQGICYFCHQFIELDGAPGWNTDHLTPISRGGTNAESNLVGTCSHCNSNKSWMTEAEFLESEFLKHKLKGI